MHPLVMSMPWASAGRLYNLPPVYAVMQSCCHMLRATTSFNMNRFRDVAQQWGVQVEGISVTCAAEKAIEAIRS